MNKYHVVVNNLAGKIAVEAESSEYSEYWLSFFKGHQVIARFNSRDVVYMIKVESDQ